MRKSTLNRMLQLADIKPVIKEGKMSLSNFELVKKSVDGNTYAIVRENKKYHIKQAQTKENLVESDFDYVGGVANKMRKSFSSFSDATKHLNFMFEEINNHYDVDSINLLESDDVLSEKKFVLKLDKKKKSKPSPVEEPKGEEEFDFGGDSEEGGEEEFDFGGDSEEGGEEEFDFGDETEDTDVEEFDSEEGGEEEFDFGDETEDTDVEEFDSEEDLDMGDSEDDIKDIQSTTGKLGQQLRDVEDLSSDMMKWVVKSVLSAVDLENMDSDDKKDIIRTVKKKSEEGGEDVENTDEEEFDFEEMEESYDSYMGDYDDDMDNMDSYNWDGIDVENEFPSYADTYRDEVNSKLDPTNINDSYDSYMEDEFNEKAFNSWMEEMEELGIVDSYDSYMEDIVGSDDSDDEYSPNRRAWESKEEDTELGGDEDDKIAQPDEVGDDMLLLDIDEEMGSEEMDALYGPNSTKRYDRSDYSKAKRQADKDISKHYYKQSAPGYEMDPVEKWAKHKLPYDTEFMGESRKINEDHFNDKMETYEQERAYEDMEKLVRRYDLDLGWCHKETTEDPEESIIYLDIVNGNKKLLKVRINSVGDIEVGEMSGKNFVGEPLDSVEDFIEIYGEDLSNKEKEEIDMKEDFEMNQPKRSPETQPNEPATKPGKPERRSPSERPSRRPFKAPPHIRPGEEPGPKADYDDDMNDPTMSPSPAPSKPSPSTEPDTKPGKPEKTPGKDRPSRRPFKAPPYIRPGEEPGPKATDDDVEFE